MELSLFSRILIYTLLFLSGAAGLIYQVVWHRYLGILLGAQAKATAIILAIFLGGISAGYAVFGRWSRTKKWNLLFAYVLVELGLAAWAILFPTFFSFSFSRMNSVYGFFGIENPLVDFAMAILLLGIPTFLMGGTLPLLTQGLSRDLKEASRTHALIYGFNTLGACLGCLLAGYFLIPRFGFAKSSFTGGAINLVVAGLAYWFFARHSSANEAADLSLLDKRIESKEPANDRPSVRVMGLWVIGLLSGFYVITLETVLIRLMGLSTGSSNYNFTLIVAIFIFGLGIGSILVRGISELRLINLLRNQVWVSLLLVAVYFSGDYWAYAGHVVRSLLRDLPENFYVYQSLLAVCIFALLTVPLALAGFTLPLCFHLVKDGKGNLGERVGQLYSLNTIGCVMGALLGGHVALNFFNLDELFKICVFACVLTAAISAFLYIREEGPNWGPIAVPCVGLLAAFTVIVAAPHWNRDNFIQPFRQVSPIDDVTFAGPAEFSKYLSRSTKLLYWKDGPNTSLGIGTGKHDGKEVSRTVFVNGKSDGNTRGDYFTTVMLAHIPALLTKKTENTLVIGFGTGVTVGTLTQYPEVKRVDVAEISNFTIKKADYFDSYNNRASVDPKVKFHEMDAFRLLQGSKSDYDIIVSEPSNPWVVGIENLYSDEFYEIVLNRLSPNGTFVQWIHTYSFNDDLFRMVMATITKRFNYVSVFQLKGGDLAVVCRREGFGDEEIKTAADRFFAVEWVRKNLLEAGIDRLDGVFALEVAPHPLPRIMGHGQPIHTLTNPLLSNGAAKAFFTGSTSRIQTLRRRYKEYLGLLDQTLLSRWLGRKPISSDAATSFRLSFCDLYVSKTNFLCEEVLAMNKLLDKNFISGAIYDDVVSSRDIAGLSAFHDMPKAVFDEKELHRLFNMYDMYKKVASPIVRVPLQTFIAPLERCLAQEKKKGSGLYGECLLQKLLVLENLVPEDQEIRNAVLGYQTWFATFPKGSENYAKFDEANTILKHLQTE